MSSVNKKRLGLIGAGDVVELFHLPALASVTGLEVAWVCDRDLDRARRLARAWRIPGWCRSLDECPEADAVLVATPVGTRLELVTAALGRSWHCFCEKPFAAAADEHGRMIAEARARRRVLGAAYLRRFYWTTKQARRMLETDCCGRLQGVIISDTAPLRKTGIGSGSYRNDPRASGGGVLAETGCHAIDQALYLSGACRVEVVDCTQVARLGLEVETRAVGGLHGSRGERVPFSLTISGIADVYDGVVLDCARGQIRLRDDPRAPAEVFTRGSDPLPLTPPAAGENLAQAAFGAEWRHFAAALDSALDWDYELETGLLATQLIEQCYRRGWLAGAAAAGAER